MNDIEELARTIRLVALTCKDKDVFSCEFGNEFHDRVLALLKETVEIKRTCRECGEGTMVPTGSICNKCYYEG
jgi:hypothetical protein